jgi:hypothetical protein
VFRRCHGVTEKRHIVVTARVVSEIIRRRRSFVTTYAACGDDDASNATPPGRPRGNRRGLQRFRAGGGGRENRKVCIPKL